MGNLQSLIIQTCDNPSSDMELGNLVVVSHVRAVNIIRDVREYITNITGGNMTRYEQLIEEATETIFSRFEEKLRDQNYDGAIAVRIAHPQVVGGGAELIVYGTGFRWKKNHEN